MAFSLRKMLSNINYFKKSEDNSENSSDANLKRRRHTYVSDEPIVINFESTEPDSTSRQCTSLKLPESLKNYAAKKGSLSDTDLLTLSVEAPVREKSRKCKKLKLDIKKASQSMNHLSQDSFNNVENTPKHVLLECKSSDVFSERFRGFDFNKSFDLIDAMSDEHPSTQYDDDIDIHSLSDESESDVSIASNKSSIKMCRKVNEKQTSDENQLVPSTSLESFSDVELDKSEEERMRLLLSYQMKLEKMECFLKRLLNEFQFHIEVSKVFRSKSIVTALPGSDISKYPKKLSQVTYATNRKNRVPSPSSWNMVMEKEDNQTKLRVKKQLLSMKSSIDEFVRLYLQNNTESNNFDNYKSITLTKKRNSISKNVSYKKKIKHFDFPDLREAMINLFSDKHIYTNDNLANISFSDGSEISKCKCKCHEPSSPTSQSDSGHTMNTNGSNSITSSIGNFSLDSSTLTAYSESLDQIVSYNSFQDVSLYGVLLQKAAIERITFYVQVHSIQLECQVTEQEFEPKNTIIFYCPSCKDTHSDENGLLRHILSQSHCEKIHFTYKTAYIKKCMSSGKEIQPSTVLNPMKMYRDDNKIVCFGDALYACSLCFENLIVGESVLMAHCSEQQHVDRREKLEDIIG